MNLIQRGTTASRANRGKSVPNSVAQEVLWNGYVRTQLGSISRVKISFGV